MLRAIASSPNLKLAWRRITTGANYQYKRFFRHLYYAYEVSLSDNLQRLHHLLLNRAFNPTPPQRVYLPKASGLQRPLGLLRLEDQIVLQAIANVFAKKVDPKRQKIQYDTVYSNILTNVDSPFFFRDWRITFTHFRNRVEEYYRAGYQWIADFDLAAFYDTISHDLLLQTVYPKTRPNAEIDYVLKLLQKWSSPNALQRHGLPQGPIASDFLAEVFLLPVDNALRLGHTYVRYVDDMRLFGRTEPEVRQAVLELEVACRERGLIPQAAKTSVRRAKSITDAVGMLPSLSAGSGERRQLTPGVAEKHLQVAIDNKPVRIIDKTRARFVFFRAQASPKLLQWAIKLLPRHPEHFDAIMAYLSQYGYRRSIETLCLSLLQQSPYEAPRGEAFHTLARFLKQRKLGGIVRRSVLDLAMSAARDRNIGFSEKWGALHFLCVAEQEGLGRYSQFCRYQNELLQACIGPVLPDAAFAPDGVVTYFLRRSAPEPSLSVTSKLLEYSIDPSSLVTSDQIPPQAANVFRELGLTSMPRTRTDAVAEIIFRRYGVDKTVRWRRFLGAEYTHALGLLAQADAVFDTGRSEWLQWQNSFNQTLFLAFQRHLSSLGLPGVIRTIDRLGHMVDYGVTLDPRNSFSRNYTNIAIAFREMNNRRNRLPTSHPYEKRTRFRTEYLTPLERNRFVHLLRRAYAEIASRI